MDNIAAGSSRTAPTSTPSNEKGVRVELPVELRDYFAAQALVSFAGDTRGVYVAVHNKSSLGNDDYGMVEREARTAAIAAYALADAMLKARLGVSGNVDE